MPGTSIDAIVQTSDLYATIADLAGVDPDTRPSLPDSVSLTPYLFGAERPRRAWVYTEAFMPNVGDTREPSDERAARDDRFKLARRDGEEHLYDLGDDVLEGKPVPNATPGAAARARRALREVLDGCWW